GKDEFLRSALAALGAIQFSRGEWKAAEERFRAYLAGGSSPPAADDAWLKLGLACLRQEHAEDALQAFDALLESFPDSPHRLQARFERGQALAALKRTDDARAAFEQVLNEGKDSRFAPFAHEHLAAIAAQNRDFGAAAKLYRLAMDAEPAGAASDAAIRRAEALAAGGEFAKAEEALNEFLRSNARSERAPQALALLAIVQSRQDRFAEALRTVATAEARGLSRLDAAMQRNMRQEQAWCLRKLGQADEAAAIYRDLLRDATAPTDWHSLLALGELDADADRLDQAIEALGRIRSAAKEDKAPPREVLESARYRLGVCQFKANKFADAAMTLEEFAVSHAESKLLPSALYFLGESHMRLSAFARAAESFGKVVESFSADAACGPSLLRLGEAHASLQDWAKSEKSFAGFLDRFAASDSWYQARFGLGWARENQGRHDEAIAAYREVVERHKGPTAARAQFQIGECLFARKQHAEAVRELLKVDILYAYPEWSAAALYEAGRCFEQLNQTGEARTQYSVVAEKHAGTRWAELAKQRLAALSAAAAAPPGGGAH
ncbi:MAG: tetratricopeptide repeat protein, partial [Planctomycetes bacterium]|nr:tetratricopeptide repeat protein [Planctomycetota bacterium]